MSGVAPLASATLSDKFELSSESVDRRLFGNQVFIETYAKRVDFRIETIEPFRNLRNMGEGFEELAGSKDAADHDAYRAGHDRRIGHPRRDKCDHSASLPTSRPVHQA